MNGNPTHDVIVIGGGYAGLSAALWLCRYRRSVLVITAGPSRNAGSATIHGYPGYDGGDPARLLTALRKEAESYGVEVVEDMVLSVQGTAGQFSAVTAAGTYDARRLLIATGTRDETPDIPGFTEIQGVTAWHCPACDGYEYSGQKIAVVGWGDHIAAYTEELLTYSSEVILYTQDHRTEVGAADRRRLEKLGIPVIDTPIRELIPKRTSTSRLRYVSLQDGTQIPTDALFYNIAQHPRLELLQSLGCKLGDACALSDHRQETRVKGVYVAGDIAGQQDLIVVACATGAAAASAIHESLK